jgi:monoamine oxidase
MIENLKRQNLRVGIIGGGPGGLMTAYLLEQRPLPPCEITIFEGDARLGGKIITQQFNAAAVNYEAGTAELYDYSRVGPDPLRELVTKLGLSIRPLGGQTVVMNNSLLKTDQDIRYKLGQKTWEALRDFDRSARSMISPMDYYESDWKEQNGDALCSETFHTFLSRVPDETARRYLEVMLHSDVATEPEHTSAMYGLQNYLMNDPDYMRLYTIVGGIESLPKALVKRIRARVRLQHRVVRVERISQHHYRIFSRHGGEIVSDDFDFVVVALPNNWILNIDWAGRLAEPMRRHHAHYDRLAHYLRVSVLFKCPFWRERIAESYFMLDEFGGCCVYDESSRYDDNAHGVLGWLLAGESALNISNLNDGAVVERMLESLPPALGYRPELFVEGHVNRWVGSVNGLPGGYPVREPESCHRPDPDGSPRLFVVGDYLFDSTLNGLFDSVDIVANWIGEALAAAETERKAA